MVISSARRCTAVVDGGFAVLSNGLLVWCSKPRSAASAHRWSELREAEQRVCMAGAVVALDRRSAVLDSYAALAFYGDESVVVVPCAFAGFAFVPRPSGAFGRICSIGVFRGGLEPTAPIRCRALRSASTPAQPAWRDLDSLLTTIVGARSSERIRMEAVRRSLPDIAACLPPHGYVET